MKARVNVFWAIEAPIDPRNDAGRTVDLTAAGRWGDVFPITGAVGDISAGPITLSVIESHDFAQGNASSLSGNLSTFYNALPDAFILHIDTVDDNNPASKERTTSALLQKTELGEVGGVVVGISGHQTSYVQLIRSGSNRTGGRVQFGCAQVSAFNGTFSIQEVLAPKGDKGDTGADGEDGESGVGLKELVTFPDVDGL